MNQTSRAISEAIKSRDEYIAILIEELTDYAGMVFRYRSPRIKDCARARTRIRQADIVLEMVLKSKKEV